jgi:hypothetical protein
MRHETTKQRISVTGYRDDSGNKIRGKTNTERMFDKARGRNLKTDEDPESQARHPVNSGRK